MSLRTHACAFAAHVNEGLLHFWRNDGEVGLPWSGPTLFGTDMGHAGNVDFILNLSNNNFEVVADRRSIYEGDYKLFHFYRDNSQNPPVWKGPFEIPNSNDYIYPSFIQRRDGSGNFELVARSHDHRKLAHFYRDNSQNPPVWKGPHIFF
jgi:hypothetical protein